MTFLYTYLHFYKQGIPYTAVAILTYSKQIDKFVYYLLLGSFLQECDQCLAIYIFSALQQQYQPQKNWAHVLMAQLYAAHVRVCPRQGSQFLWQTFCFNFVNQTVASSLTYVTSSISATALLSTNERKNKHSTCCLPLHALSYVHTKWHVQRDPSSMSYKHRNSTWSNVYLGPSARHRHRAKVTGYCTLYLF